MILAGRRLNDGMGAYVVSQLVKNMLKKQIQVDGANVLVMGLTFKENCPDLRNTKVTDIISELKEYNINVDVTDPWCSSEQAEGEYGLSLVKAEEGKYDAIVLAVAHNEFKELGVENIRKFGKKSHVLYDLKYLLPKEAVDMRL
jgi:UDP-N-acetyl-D-galactosamine dehydrogenase